MEWGPAMREIFRRVKVKPLGDTGPSELKCVGGMGMIVENFPSSESDVSTRLDELT